MKKRSKRVALYPERICANVTPLQRQMINDLAQVSGESYAAGVRAALDEVIPQMNDVIALGAMAPEPSRKPAARKAPARKKAPRKKTATKKATRKKAPRKKATRKKTSQKKAPRKKTATKKASTSKPRRKAPSRRTRGQTINLPDGIQLTLV